MNIIFLSIDGAQKHREVSKAEPKAARQLRADGQMLSGYSGPQRGDYPKYPAAPRGTQIDKWFIIRQLGKGFRGFFCDFQESDVSSHTDSGQSAKQVIGTLLPELR